jgi:hypothetical protein
VGQFEIPRRRYCTAKVAEPRTVPELAVIVTLPEATPVTKPPLLTVATVLSLEVQLAVLVMSFVVPLELLAVATNCCVLPIAIDAFAGVTAIEVTVDA